MPTTLVERLTAFRNNDLQELCEAAEEGIKGGGGFGWLKPPPRNVMESYWRGIMLIPDRQLFVGRLDGVIAGTAQLVRPARNNEAQASSAQISIHFVAPWARGHGLARQIVVAAENAAQTAGVRLVKSGCAGDPERGDTAVSVPGVPALGNPSALCPGGRGLGRRTVFLEGIGCLSGSAGPIMTLFLRL